MIWSKSYLSLLENLAFSAEHMALSDGFWCFKMDLMFIPQSVFCILSRATHWAWTDQLPQDVKSGWFDVFLPNNIVPPHPKCGFKHPFPMLAPLQLAINIWLKFSLTAMSPAWSGGNPPCSRAGISSNLSVWSMMVIQTPSIPMKSTMISTMISTMDSTMNSTMNSTMISSIKPPFWNPPWLPPRPDPVASFAATEHTDYSVKLVWTPPASTGGGWGYKNTGSYAMAIYSHMAKWCFFF